MGTTHACGLAEGAHYKVCQTEYKTMHSFLEFFQQRNMLLGRDKESVPCAARPLCCSPEAPENPDKELHKSRMDCCSCQNDA